MRRLLILPVIFLFFSFGSSSYSPMPDPASAYCKFLGYNIVTRKDFKGNEYGVCLFPDGSECEVWSFYRGICGKKFSYCSKKGCDTYSINEDRGPYQVIYCACECLDSLGNKKVIPLTQFMEQNGDTLIKSKPGIKGGTY